MSLNPVLCQDIHTKDLLPLCTTGEAYVLFRANTKITLELSSRKLAGSGDIVMTTRRLVFIKKRDKDFKKSFSSINVPFSHLETPKFEQPIFGTNHMIMKVKSDTSGEHPLESEAEFKIFFVTGGADLFLRLFFSFYAKFRNDPSRMSSSRPVNELDPGSCAFVDPSDTSFVYFTQPSTSNQVPNSNAELDQHENERPKKTKVSAKTASQGVKGLSFLRFFR